MTSRVNSSRRPAWSRCSADKASFFATSTSPRSAKSFERLTAASFAASVRNSAESFATDCGGAAFLSPESCARPARGQLNHCERDKPTLHGFVPPYTHRLDAAPGWRFRR